jgi:hypothetical protein
MGYSLPFWGQRGLRVCFQSLVFVKRLELFDICRCSNWLRTSLIGNHTLQLHVRNPTRRTLRVPVHPLDSKYTNFPDDSCIFLSHSMTSLVVHVCILSTPVAAIKCYVKEEQGKPLRVPSRRYRAHNVHNTSVSSVNIVLTGKIYEEKFSTSMPQRPRPRRR